MSPSCFTVLFSSVASLLGSPGQANYSAANAALDSAATTASALGLPALSVQWGAWAGGGMAAGDAGTAARVERTGMAMVTPSLGLRALEAALSATASSLAAAVISVTPFLWGAFLGRFRSQGITKGGRLPPLFQEQAEAAGPEDIPISPSTKRGQITKSGTIRRVAMTKDQVRMPSFNSLRLDSDGTKTFQWRRWILVAVIRCACM